MDKLSIERIVQAWNDPKRTDSIEWGRETVENYLLAPTFLIHEGKLLMHQPHKSEPCDGRWHFTGQGGSYDFKGEYMLQSWDDTLEECDLLGDVRYQYSRHEGYECSSAGDKRFSAFYAHLGEKYKHRTIEQVYQCDVKGFDPGGYNWRLGKGKSAKNGKSPEQLWEEYYALWCDWLEPRKAWMPELRWLAWRNKCVLRDSYASSPINQARAMAQWLSEHPHVRTT